jgi:hypothetical protein
VGVDPVSAGDPFGHDSNETGHGFCQMSNGAAGLVNIGK